MAIYKPPKARWPLALFVGIAAFLLGIGIGLLLGKEEPNAAEGIRLVQQEMTSAAAGLEVAGIEYSEAVDDTGVVSDAEYQGALDALESSRTRYETVHDALATLSPDLAGDISIGYEEAAAAMQDEAPPDEVDALLDELSSQLKGES